MVSQYEIHASEIPPARIKRFWQRVDKSGECWLFPSNTAIGYTMFSVRYNESVAVHVFAYLITYGDIPDGLIICHSCEERYPFGDRTYRRCVRPEHLYAGTYGDNARDCARHRAREKLARNSEKISAETY